LAKLSKIQPAHFESQYFKIFMAYFTIIQLSRYLSGKVIAIPGKIPSKSGKNPLPLV
jgi:hypothetical protein